MDSTVKKSLAVLVAAGATAGGLAVSEQDATVAVEAVAQVVAAVAGLVLVGRSLFLKLRGPAA